MSQPWLLPPQSAAEQPATLAPHGPSFGEADPALDPLVLWGRATGWIGMLQGGDGGLRVAIELPLDGGQRRAAAQALLAMPAPGAAAGPDQPWLQLAPLHRQALSAATPPRFLTARVSFAGLRALAQVCWRVKPAYVGSGQARDGAAPPAPAPSGALLAALLASGQQIEAAARLRASLGDALFEPLTAAPAESTPPPPANAGPSAAPVEPVACAASAPPIFGVIDFGIAFAHPRLRGELRQAWAGRVRYLWDQGRSAAWAPAGQAPRWRSLAGDFAYGRELSSAEMAQAQQAAEALVGSRDQVLLEQTCYALLGLPELLDPVSHGTAVLDLATGRDDGADRWLDDVDVIAVQLPEAAVQDVSGGWMATYVIDAVRYILARAAAIDPRAPVVINLSYGHFAGSHDGLSLLECFLDDLIDTTPGLSIVLPAGNLPDDGRATHAEGEVAPGQSARLDWFVEAGDPTQSFLQVWIAGDAVPEVTVTDPRYQADLVLNEARRHAVWRPVGQAAPQDWACAVWLRSDCRSGGRHALQADDTRPADGLAQHLLYLAMKPTLEDERSLAWGSAAPPGAWRVQIHNPGRVPMRIGAWVERDEPGRDPRPERHQSSLSAPAGGALRASTRDTLIALAGGARTWVVDGSTPADGHSGPPPPHYGRGAQGSPRRRPDIAAPAARRVGNSRVGVEVMANVGEGRFRMEGTSLSAALLSRGLLEEWATGTRELRDHHGPVPPPTTEPDQGRSVVMLGRGPRGEPARQPIGQGSEAPASA